MLWIAPGGPQVGGLSWVERRALLSGLGRLFFGASAAYALASSAFVVRGTLAGQVREHLPDSRARVGICDSLADKCVYSLQVGSKSICGVSCGHMVCP